METNRQHPPDYRSKSQTPLRQPVFATIHSPAVGDRPFRLMQSDDENPLHDFSRAKAFLSSFFVKRPSCSRRKHRLRFTTFSQPAEVLEVRRLLATIVVNDDGANAMTIQEAIDAADPGDTILVTGGSDGIHTEAGIIVNQDVTIQGASGTTQVIVQAASTPGTAIDRVFMVPEFSSAVIDNLTIRHGQTMNGGAILNDGELHLTNAFITKNIDRATGFGTGAVVNRNVLTIRNSTISQNTTSNEVPFSMGNSGAIGNTGNLTVINSTISSNSGGEAGGINTFFGDAFVANSTIIHNEVRGQKNC